MDALTLVTSGGRRNGAHSYSSDISESQPVGNQVRRAAGRLLIGCPPRVR
ncbi:Uncharacterised protein [Mycobacterium tuberculosis]|uniref:Uncharacterized protein n=1 Tax=Mycobacterium tuberculosis TaxID=1773 RepID=A0A654U6B3_MYCTX|nr:Uncharacterised protein [Mycobacterium tuberculosis]CKT64058.1 Uncharacterised protein [Mycobacterium tuberculosis]